ncbi:MAG: hypothetical protein FJ034_00180 [Chloroflexi bacterium]|nr:hypothetical protein [Chloroflexota bacterium]
MSVVHTATPLEAGRLLGDLLGTLGSTYEADEVLRSLVDRLASIDGCTAAAVYVWDPDAQRFARRIAAPATSPLATSEEYELGESIVGRAGAAPGKQVQGALGAARTMAVATGIGACDGRPCAVVVLSGEASFLRAATTGRVVADLARVAGLALDRQETRDYSRRTSELLEAVDLLGRASGGEMPLSEVLAGLAAISLRATGGTACVLYVADRGSGELRLAAVAPRGGEVPPVWRGGQDAPAISHVALPALAGSSRVGMLVICDDRPHRFTLHERQLYERLARVAAVAIRQRQLLEGSSQRARPEELLWEIVRPNGSDPAATAARAKRLGCVLSEPRVVITATAGPEGNTERLRASLQLLDRATIADASEDRLVAIVAAPAAANLDSHGCSVGVSQPCKELTRYPLAYEQAKEALGLGQRLFGAGRTVRFDELGSYRFVTSLVQGGLTDEREYRQVSTLGDELLRTLEAYLDNGGNTALAAKQLFLHRNTLRQRLERISTLLDLDLSPPTRWLPLQLAVKTARIARLAQPTADPPKRSR